MTYSTERQDYLGVASPTIWQLLNPIWHFLNDAEPTPPDWYKAEQPNLTLLKWYLRNPFQNAGRFGFGFTAAWIAAIIGSAAWWWELSYWWCLLALLFPGGAEHIRHSTLGCSPLAYTTYWDYNQLSGWKWHVLFLHNWWPLPFVSYESPRVIFYAGWQADGFFGYKFNLKTNLQLW